MIPCNQPRRLAMLSVLAFTLGVTGCGGGSSTPASPGTPSPSPTGFLRTNLVANKSTISDAAGPAAKIDANLVNPWGIAFAPNAPIWIANNNSGTLTLYDGTGISQSPPIPVATPTAATGGAATGMVFNPTTEFRVAGTPASFITATEDGTIMAWSGGGATHIVANEANQVLGAVYKGLALANADGQFLLFATNFSAGRVDVFDTNFRLVRSFTDPTVDAGFAPFGIQRQGANLLVTFALQDMAKHDDVRGAGNGFVDLFNTNGILLRRFASHGSLNSPWGLVTAPASFGQFANDLLIGNFGDGHINAYTPGGVLAGQLADANNNPIAISGLWGLAFGGGGLAGDTNTLYFTAGINGEQDGLFGKIVPAQ